MLLTAGGQPEYLRLPCDPFQLVGDACELGLECSREGCASLGRETGKSHRPEEDVAAPSLSHSRMGEGVRGYGLVGSSVGEGRCYGGVC